ncbi:sugar phosphate isomerase [Streptomyces sp. WZ.A104]|uniref:EboA domain-containing protein n=1 Tax=Streptomyces sp. WZ.A104 TaxID=2023771 RepID=UPI000BBC6F33|nr:EboA domain-containing protein [Streptomyces sp. WZ.A104]PCG83870.1 sugar phosphate isomerase [Streptomyces sp. WZ.A104]
MLKSREELDTELDDTARTWLAEALTETAPSTRTPSPHATSSTPSISSAPSSWELRYAAAGRHCGPEHADSVRSLLLVAARASLRDVARLYEQGTAAERRAVLLTLHLLDLGDTALPLVDDALRTNDTRLITAAVGPYAAAHLEPHAWRHAVLKCLFTGVPVEAVARLGERAHGDAELARMLSDFAAERTAAGRTVPEDLRTVLALTTPAAPTEES